MKIIPDFITNPLANTIPSLGPDFKTGLIDDLAQSKYNFRYLTFPNDLGFDDVGHYMVININVPTKLDDNATPAGNYGGYFNPVVTNGLPQRSKVDVLRYGGATGATPFVNTSSPNAPLLNVPRFTRRIEESIALYMPTPLVFNTNNIYEEISLTKLGGKLMVGAASSLAFVAGAGASLNGGMSKASKKVFSALGDVVGGVTTAAKLTGNPINPMNEIIFASTAVRQFAFELLMAPRNEEESISIHSIIKTLRFHSAPEINTNTYGLTWIAPAEFDITFFNKGVENMNILRINTCVLERIEVDYAPAAGTFSTFRNGHPVAVRLSLGFREVEPIHKQRVLQGF